MAHTLRSYYREHLKRMRVLRMRARIEQRQRDRQEELEMMFAYVGGRVFPRIVDFTDLYPTAMAGPWEYM